MIFLLAAAYGLIVAAIIATAVWLYRLANGMGEFPIVLLAVLWPLGIVAVLVWFYFSILETT